MTSPRIRLAGLCWLLPPCRAKNALLTRLGHRVHPSARIGICVMLDVDEVVVGADTIIGHGNVFRGLRAVRIGVEAILGQFNWFSRAPSLTLPDDELAGSLVMGDHSVLTSRHYVDCSGGLWMGRFATVAGVRTTVLSHTIDLGLGRQGTRPVRLSDRVFVGSNATMMPGTTAAAGAVFAAGSVTALDGEYAAGMLYGGVPAKQIKPIDGAYFHRTRTWSSQ